MTRKELFSEIPVTELASKSLFQIAFACVRDLGFELRERFPT